LIFFDEFFPTLARALIFFESRARTVRAREALLRGAAGRCVRLISVEANSELNLYIGAPPIVAQCVMSFLFTSRCFMTPALNPFGMPGGFASGSFLGCIAAKKRRQTEAAALLAELDQSAGHGPQGPKSKDRTRFNWARHIYTLSPQEFRLRYRLSYSAFMDLLDVIRHELTAKDLAQARRSKGGRLRYARVREGKKKWRQMAARQKSICACVRKPR
jgi:hypothetical protein